MSKMHYFCNNF